MNTTFLSNPRLHSRTRSLARLTTIFLLGLVAADSAQAGITSAGTPVAQYAISSTMTGYTVPAGTNRLLVVTASDAGSSTPPSAVTFNGTSMQLKTSVTDGSIASDSIWVLALGTSPSATTGNIVITASGGVQKFIGASVFEGVDQTAPAAAGPGFGDPGGSALGSSIDVPSVVGDVVYDVFDTFTNAGQANISVGGGHALVHSAGGAVTLGVSAAGSAHYVTSSGPGMNPVTMGWTTADAEAVLHATIRIKLAISVVAPGDLVIREFRSRGPVGAGSATDEYVVVDNRTSNQLTLGATDGSDGFAVAKEGGTRVFTIPSGTVIPAKGHFLGANTTNGATVLGITPDASWTADIADGQGLALFKSATNFTAPNLLDAVGFTPGLYAEGTVLPSLGAVPGEYAWVRKAPNGIVQDTNSNLGTVLNPGDFTLVSTDGTVGMTYNGVPSVLGAPSPTGLNTWDELSDFTVTVADPLIGVNNVPNRARLVDAPGGGDRMEFRRRITNNSSTTFTSLRLRLVEVTVVNSPGYATATPTQADMRPNTSVNVTVTSSLASPSPGPISPLGLTLLTPPVQANFGGLNSILTIPGGPLGPGQSRDINMSFKIFRVGGYRFFATIEAR